MNWTKTKPTALGHYWYRRNETDEPEIVAVDFDGIIWRIGSEGCLDADDLVNAEFAGPLVEPK